ncbi:serine hydrolase [Streptacidiphilus sp. N1-3]|uniref:Serine hydrolase n=1 Tax=Streptacidiphilus alkalitolerans TaxID=3342712 RepID=A0ABV6WXC0_9ACTN
MSKRSRGRRRRAKPRSRSRAGILYAVVGVTAVAVLTAVLLNQSAPAGTAVSSSDGLSPSVQPSGGSGGTASPKPSATATEPARKPTAKATKAASVAGTDALRDAVSRAAGATSVAVTDLTTGRTLDYGGDGHGFACASIAKLDVLATLLLEDQDKGTELTAAEQALATKMIEHSDNAAADSLYTTLGKAPGMDAANKRFGMTSTHSGEGILWGVTTTTAADQVTLLRQVFTSSSLLSAASRTYIQGLLSQVESDQRWGVSAAATSDDYELKNGWLPRSTTGLWVVNSTGRVDRDGHQLLISVLSDGNPTMDQGIDLIESVAKAAAEALLPG